MLFAKLPRPTFAGPKADDAQAVRLPFRGKALRRRQAMVRAARELLPHLPTEPGAAMHTLLVGRIDLMVVLAEMLAHYGGTCQHLRLATLSFNARNAAEMAMLLQSGRVASLTLLCSHFFRHHNSEEYAEAKRQADRFPDRWRIAAIRNHAKVSLLDFGSFKIVAESSANLRANGNMEQLTVIRDAALHDWHAMWIDAEVTRHEQEVEEDASE